MQFGISTDNPVPGDFDGDGKADVGVYRPSVGIWYVLRSLDSSVNAVAFGSAEDVPVPSGYIAE